MASMVFENKRDVDPNYGRKRVNAIKAAIYARKPRRKRGRSPTPKPIPTPEKTVVTTTKPQPVPLPQVSVAHMPSGAVLLVLNNSAVTSANYGKAGGYSANSHYSQTSPAPDLPRAGPRAI